MKLLFAFFVLTFCFAFAVTSDPLRTYDRPDEEHDCNDVDTNRAEKKFNERLEKFMPEIETAVRLRSKDDYMVVKFQKVVAARQCQFEYPDKKFATGYNVTAVLIHSHCNVNEPDCKPLEKGPNNWDKTICYALLFSEKYYYDLNECYDVILGKGNGAKH